MEEIHRALAPILDEAGLELVDLELQSGLLRVTVDREGGVDLEALSNANRLVSRALDQIDPIPGRYTLEVSSPGLERPLRRPEHFVRALGKKVTVRTLPGVGEARRLTGLLANADREGITIEGPDVPDGKQSVRYSEVERARTVFEWGASAAPKRSPKKAGASTGRSDHRAPKGDPRVRNQGEEVKRS